MTTICAITNVYNEGFNLKIWLNYYGRQVGISNCIVLDHGTDDGSTLNLMGANRIPLPRGDSFSDQDRLYLINNFVNGLLKYYDAVIYTDADEIIVADPNKYNNIIDYIINTNEDVHYAIGLNMRANIIEEGQIDDRSLILQQRKYVQFVTPMCKPLIIRRPVRWSPGFHFCNFYPKFDDLYLFHLRHVCALKAILRLDVTRNITFSQAGGGAHQRRPDVEYVRDSFCSVHRLTVRDDWDFSQWLKAHTDGIEIDANGLYAPRKDIRSNCLYKIPTRFRSLF